MGSDNVIASIDIGSAKIRTVIWNFSEENGRDFNVLGVWISTSNAIRKWNILDMEEFKNNLDKSLEEAEKMAGEQISGVHLSLNSSSMEVVTSKWIIAVSGEEITEEDIDRVLDMAKNGVDLPNREILKVIPEYFVVDLEDWVRNPLGMSARKLEVVANIFSINKNILWNITKAVADVWIEIYDIFPNLLASPEWVLTKRQKELGVVCIDIGAATTWVTIFEEGVLKFSSIIPIGWDSVTNDIALGIRTSIDVAEALKLDYSEVNLAEQKTKDKEISLNSINRTEEWTVSSHYVNKIATARYEEILMFVRDELKRVGKDGMLPEWAMLVWGGSKQKWLLELVKEILRLPAFVWIPVEKESLTETSISDPVFSGVIGSMILANKYASSNRPFSLNISGFFTSIIKVFKKILP